ncbi:Hypothetical protein NTJ_06072 [Nesidiocoris tenuis]|uniref:Uncharacterized protein n=1 Tax=Nesidiocoris tenuis TaxID=355587 RepID=A0ABN7AMU4_9HEMI|nr:Hypothetical protein NTJ_06072 [Nesidiocoris tenuis]
MWEKKREKEIDMEGGGGGYGCQGAGGGEEGAEPGRGTNGRRAAPAVTSRGARCDGRGERESARGIGREARGRERARERCRGGGRPPGGYPFQRRGGAGAERVPAATGRFSPSSVSSELAVCDMHNT